MTIAVNLYSPGQSWLHKTDPRVKLLFVACCIFLLILFNNLWVMTAALLLFHLLHWSAGTPLARIGFIWRTLLPIGLLMLILRLIFYPVGETLLTVWIVEVTVGGLAQGLVLALRIVTMAFAVFAWLYTTSQPDLVQSFVKLGMPHEWGLVLALALRYIPTFQGMFWLVSEAQQARGLDMRQHSGFPRWYLRVRHGTDRSTKTDPVVSGQTTAEAKSFLGYPHGPSIFVPRQTAHRPSRTGASAKSIASLDATTDSDTTWGFGLRLGD